MCICINILLTQAILKPKCTDPKKYEYFCSKPELKYQQFYVRPQFNKDTATNVNWLHTFFCALNLGEIFYSIFTKDVQFYV